MIVFSFHHYQINFANETISQEMNIKGTLHHLKNRAGRKQTPLTLRSPGDEIPPRPGSYEQTFFSSWWHPERPTQRFGA